VAHVFRRKCRFAQRFGELDFIARKCWLFRFCIRHGIANRKFCGESLNADDASVEPALENTQANKNDSSVPGRELNKEHLTALACATAGRSHSLKPVITGKSAKPHIIRDLPDILCFASL
jgi:hypothetical protein